jgi:outer membrane receptor protein involved in Fe transport
MTSIAAFEYWEWLFGEGNRTFNPPGDVVVFVRPFASNELNGWSQEVRLASPSAGAWEYVFGLFASGSTSDVVQDFLFNISGEPDPAAAIYLFDQETAKNENLTYAVFGEADFHLTGEWTATAGLHVELQDALKETGAGSARDGRQQG